MDVVFKHTNDFWFNEITTCHSSQAGIRDAIGQRLECVHWPKGVAAEKMIVAGDQSLGFDEVCLLGDDTVLAFTALTDGQPRIRDHWQRFLGHTRLACLQWINLNHHDIEFTTLLGSGRTMGAGR